MTLTKAWIEIKQMNGSKSFDAKKIYSILDDFGVFKEMPRMRLVVKSALKYGIWNVIVMDNNSSNIRDIVNCKLRYDGFSEEIINLLNETFIKNQAVQHDNPSESIAKSDKDYKQSEDRPTEIQIHQPSALSFMGIPLGEKISIFNDKLTKNGFTNKKSHVIDCEHTFEFIGKFAGMNDCKVTLFYSISSMIVYKVEVSKTKTFRGYAVDYNHILDLYVSKYGPSKTLLVDKNFGGVDKEVFFPITESSRIEIATGTVWGNRIRYIDLKLNENVMVEVALARQEKNKKIKSAKEAQKIRNLQDI